MHNFTDLNKVCPKEAFPLPNIDRLVYGTFGYAMIISFHPLKASISISTLRHEVPHFGELVSPLDYEANLLSPVLEPEDRSLIEVDNTSQLEFKLQVDEDTSFAYPLVSLLEIPSDDDKPIVMIIVTFLRTIREKKSFKGRDEV